MSWKTRSKELKRKRKEAASDLQDWLTKRKEASKKRLEAEREDHKSQPRGVDRVPEHLKNLGEHSYKVTAETEDANHSSRRQTGKITRIRPVRIPRDTIFHQKDWTGELTDKKVPVEGTKGPIGPVNLRSGSNDSYVNHEKDRSLPGKARRRARRG